MSLTEIVNKVKNEVYREYRKPITVAFQYSDGTVLGFQQELAAQSWDYPTLPVQDIIDRIKVYS